MWIAYLWNLIYTELSETLFDIFYKKFNNIEYSPNFNAKANRIIKETHGKISEKQNIITLLENKFNDLLSAKSGLMDKAPNLTEGQFNNIVLSAMNANLAVFTYLKSKIDQKPFVFPVLYE